MTRTHYPTESECPNAMVRPTLRERMKSITARSVGGVLLLGACFIAPSPAEAVVINIVSDVADGEVRQSSAGAYTIADGSPDTHLRVGFQSSFGSDGQPYGGLSAVWFFRLPHLNLQAGATIDDVDFITTLLDESSSVPITPRFNADLYALGFVSAPVLEANDLFFFAGQTQDAIPGLGEGQYVQKIDDDFFTIFSDWDSVNNPDPSVPNETKVARPFSIDDTARILLRYYIEDIYNNPAFPNTGNEYLVLRLNPDRAANEQYLENGNVQFYGKGTSRYRVASGESAALQSTASVDYSQVVPTQLVLTVSIPEPGTATLLALAGVTALATRRRREV